MSWYYKSKSVNDHKQNRVANAEWDNKNKNNEIKINLSKVGQNNKFLYTTILTKFSLRSFRDAKSSYILYLCMLNLARQRNMFKEIPSNLLFSNMMPNMMVFTENDCSCGKIIFSQLCSSFQNIFILEQKKNKCCLV